MYATRVSALAIVLALHLYHPLGAAAVLPLSLLVLLGCWLAEGTSHAGAGWTSLGKSLAGPASMPFYLGVLVLNAVITSHLPPPASVSEPVYVSASKGPVPVRRKVAADQVAVHPPGADVPVVAGVEVVEDAAAVAANPPDPLDQRSRRLGRDRRSPRLGLLLSKAMRRQARAPAHLPHQLHPQESLKARRPCSPKCARNWLNK